MKIAILKRLIRDQQGTSALEMGLIACLIVIAMFSALQGFANENDRTWNAISSKVSQASQKANAG
ncbi:MAG: Flp family type IVb pilin [Sphingomonadaceae bacterium]|jgi:Flp pilus assembly pilin Flp|nr:Flp family type IVb pilin [Sphingomonadaceae bacterium]